MFLIGRLFYASAWQGLNLAKTTPRPWWWTWPFELPCMVTVVLIHFTVDQITVIGNEISV